jgi:hypothetical protein
MCTGDFISGVRFDIKWRPTEGAEDILYEARTEVKRLPIPRFNIAVKGPFRQKNNLDLSDPGYSF